MKEENVFSGQPYHWNLPYNISFVVIHEKCCIQRYLAKFTETERMDNESSHIEHHDINESN
jgi:hypothetical protein